MMTQTKSDPETAFVETSGLTDLLLKKDGSEIAVKDTLSKFKDHLVPQFSWKEFKRGPLRYFKWAHNKLGETGSFNVTMIALQRLSGTPHKYLTSTAIQAIHSAFSEAFKDVSLGDLKSKYGAAAELDHVLADALRLELKQAIFSSWSKRHDLFGGQVQSLPCYTDADLFEKKLRIETSPDDCPSSVECCLRQWLVSRRPQLAAARSAVRDGSDRAEISKRYKVLRRLEKHPHSSMDRKDCRNFGDAYFVLFCPSHAAIVTNNIRDIRPMATALEIVVKRAAGDEA